MRVVHVAVMASILAPAPVAAQSLTQSQAGTGAPGAAQPPAVTSSTRTFTAPVGVLFNAVRPDRVADFEKLLGYLEAALAAATDATIGAQAQGWRIFKASEPGPNGSVLYVFLLDPAVPGADYSLGRILAEAIPDPAQLQQVWKLYTDSVTSGGSLLNLTPLQPPAPGPEALIPLPRMLPPQNDPARKP